MGSKSKSSAGKARSLNAWDRGASSLYSTDKKIKSSKVTVKNLGNCLAQFMFTLHWTIHIVMWSANLTAWLSYVKEYLRPSIASSLSAKSGESRRQRWLEYHRNEHLCGSEGPVRNGPRLGHQD